MGKPAAPSDMPKPLRVTPVPHQKGGSLALPMMCSAMSWASCACADSEDPVHGVLGELDIF